LPYQYLGYTVRGFFENGGEHCVVIPVQSDLSNPIAMVEALIHTFGPRGVLEDNDFEDIDIDLVCVPDAMAEPIRKIGRSAILEIQSATLEHCHRMGDRFAILDGFKLDVDNSKGSHLSTDAFDSVRSHWQALPPEHGALYYPWISVGELRSATSSVTSNLTEMPCDQSRYVADGIPITSMVDARYVQRLSQKTLCIPPCGHVAGVYSRTDLRTGVHKAPANEVLEDALGLEIGFSGTELGELNDAGINCLRSFPDGIRVWGARTLSGQQDWLYINVRRLFLTLARWVRQNMNNLVFEPNNSFLWERVVRQLSGYCSDLFNKGALAGNSPAEAYFVKCDAETNPLESREMGRVVAHVGLAPVIPAEFVVVRITQSPSAIAVTDSVFSK
jgi:hypothetical protein